MSEPLTLYKLIILEMLKKVNFPLTNSQISEFILEKEYTTYFTLQQVISELVESNLVSMETIRNTSQYHLTDAGLETLEYFEYKVSKPIQEDIEEYLKLHKIEMRNEVSIVAEYFKNTNNEYEAHCQVKERGSNLIDLTISVPLKEQAISICDNWPKKCQPVYEFIMKELM